MMQGLVELLKDYHTWYRVLLIAGGLTCFYSAFLMYEDEEGRVQNRLEDWWCRLDDAANTAVNYHLRIVQSFAKNANTRLELSFGEKLISYQSIGVAICWGMISAKLTVVILGLISRPLQTRVIVFELVGCFCFMYFSRRPRFLPSSQHRLWFIMILITWIAFILVAYLSGTARNRIAPVSMSPEGSQENIVVLGLAVIPLYTVGVLFCIPVCLAFVATLRRSLAYITQAKSNTRVITATILQTVFSAAIISLHLLAVRNLKSRTDFREYVLQVTTPITGYAYAMSLLLLLLVGHIAFWGVMRRPLYLLQRIGGERRKRVFAAIGLVMLSLAIPRVTEILKGIGVDLVTKLIPF